MNRRIQNHARVTRVLAAMAVMSLTVVGCATAPQSPPGAAEVRSKLTRLQTDPNLGSRAPVEIREAAAAVQIAEQPVPKDAALGEHRVYMADRKVEIAMAKASTRYAEDQRAGLDRERAQARLDARTREADRAQRQTAMAKSEAEASRAGAAASAADAARNAAELQRQIAALKAEATDRGLVLTLGNVLFATGRSDLKPGGVNSLDKLVVFLNEYPERTAAIEGHTDNVGSDDSNRTLSRNRAESVRSYLLQQGIESWRLTATGMGETRPVADNGSESGRQQNRRVEIIIANPPSAVAATAKQ
jgi:outer membrane protein OmpA-like peptidoglycan-associated protein